MTVDHDHGTLDRLDDGKARLTFARHVPHEIDTVWAAVSEPEGLQKWFPSAIEGERREGATLRFTFADMPDAPVEEGPCLAYDPPHAFAFDWGGDVVRIELAPITGGTRLELTATFDDYTKSARDAGGWHACLDNLGYALDGEDPPFDPAEHWRDTTPWYRENFPPEATTAPMPDFHPDAAAINAEQNL